MDYLFQLKKCRSFFYLIITSLLTGCVTPPPPSDLNNVCRIFREYPKWLTQAQDVERRWKVPVAVQMAIIHQESKFDAHARPSRTKLFFIPWRRPTSAYGYAQALHGTWREYKQSNGGFFSSRHDFGDGVDFIGWYANQAYRRARIDRTDAYSLYLAYHEGIGGYQRKTYLRKAWLLPVARKVKARSQLYSMQLRSCRENRDSRPWF